MYLARNHLKHYHLLSRLFLYQYQQKNLYLYQRQQKLNLHLLILHLCLLILLLGISIRWIRKLYLNAKKNEFFGRDRSSSCSCSSMDLSEIERNRCDSITSSEGCDCEQCCGQGSQYIQQLYCYKPKKRRFGYMCIYLFTFPP